MGRRAFLRVWSYDGITFANTCSPHLKSSAHSNNASNMVTHPHSLPYCAGLMFATAALVCGALSGRADTALAAPLGDRPHDPEHASLDTWLASRSQSEWQTGAAAANSSSIGVVTVCAARFATSEWASVRENNRAYARLHGYRFFDGSSDDDTAELRGDEESRYEVMYARLYLLQDIFRESDAPEWLY